MSPQLKHDAQGFLVGSGPIPGLPTEGKTLLRIADDVRVMRRILEKGGKTRGAVVLVKTDEAEKPKNEAAEPAVVSAKEGRGVIRPVAPGLVGDKIAQATGNAKVALPRRASNDESAALLAQLATRLSQGSRQGRDGGGVAKVATPQRARDERGRFIAVRQDSGDNRKPARPAGRTVGAKDGAAGRQGGAGQPTGRDTRGRFTGDGKREGSESLLDKAITKLTDKMGDLANVSGDAGEVDPNLKAAGEVADAAVKTLGGVKAVGGVALSLAKPIGRGMGKLFGTGRPTDAPTHWFKRFFTEMRLFRREQSTFNKTELRALKDIEAGTAQGGKGLAGMLGGLLMGLGGMILSGVTAAAGMLFGGLAKLPLLGSLTGAVGGRILGRSTLPTTVQAGRQGGITAPEISTAPGPGKPGEAPKAGKPGIWGRMGRGVGGLMSRLPWVGAGVAAVGIGAEAYASENRTDIGREEKDRRTGAVVGKGAGGLGGMLAGGAVGAKVGAVVGAFAGPLGAAIGTGLGAVVGGAAAGFFGEKAGSILGEKFGAWVSDLRNADIPGKIGTAWVNFTSDLSAGLAKLGINLPAMKDKLAEASLAAQRGYAQATGKPVELGDAQANAARRLAAQADPRRIDGGTPERPGLVQQAAEGAGRFVGQAQDMAGKGLGAVSAKVAQAWQAAKVYLAEAAVKAGVDPAVVAKIANIESGFDSAAVPRQGGRLLSSAHGYGQFLDGTWTDMLNRHGAKYGVAGAGSLTKEQAGALRSDKGLQASMLAEFTRENIAKGRQLGGQDDDANVYAFHNLGDGDARRLLKAVNASPEMSVRDALLAGSTSEKDRARVERVIGNNKLFYGDGSVSAGEAYGRMGNYMRRGDVFAEDARAAARSVAAPKVGQLPIASVTAPVVAASAPSLTPPPMAKVPPLPDAPEVNAGPQTSDRVSSLASQRPQVVLVPQPTQAGRDLPDRKIAHIVTGGMAT